MWVDVEWGACPPFVLLLHHAIHLDARVGAHQGAALAPYALLGGFHISVMVASVVHIFLLKRKHSAGACRNTQVATLAALFVYNYCSLNFHYYVSFCFSMANIVIYNRIYASFVPILNKINLWHTSCYGVNGLCANCC